MKKALGVLAIAVIAAVLFTGCLEKEKKKSDNSKPQKSTSQAKPKSKAKPKPKPTPLKKAASVTVRQFAFIKSFYQSAGIQYLKADYAEFLMGAAADKAAIQDGQIKPGEHVDNDYYVRNKSPMTKDLKISSSVTVTLDVTSDVGIKKAASTLTELKNIYNGKVQDKSYVASNESFWLTITGDTVTKIEHQFRP
ncbi:MAG: hypothetical protein C4562_04505 [Actinobacteria bacterium]|nr:MAG: hypothetical protein C4562_04505 [Actinomycetota bacterium]